MTSRTRRAHGRRAPRPRRDSRSGRGARPARPRRDLSADRRAAPRETSEPARPRRRPRAPRTAAQAGRERERDALGDDEAAARLEVRPHPLGVDLETGDGVRGRRCRSAGERERTRESLPLGVPAAHRALVLVGELAEQDSRVGVRETLARDRERRADGIPLLRHRRGTASRTPRRPRPPRVWARSTTSRPTFAAAPAAASSAAPSSARRWRFACQGSRGSASPSSCA